MNFNIDEQQATQLAQQIRLLLLDVDGVLTDGSLYFSEDGSEIKAFNTQDGHGIRMLLANDINVGIITGRSSKIVENRALDLGITLLYQNQSDKHAALEDILVKHNYGISEIAYAGDDLPDLPVSNVVGLSFAVANAHSIVLNKSMLITSRSGGKGAVREISDYLLQSQDKYEQYLS